MTTIYVKSSSNPYSGLGFCRFDIEGEKVTTIYSECDESAIQSKEGMYRLKSILSSLGSGLWALDPDGESKEASLRAKLKGKEEERAKREEDEKAAGHYRALV